MRIGVRKVACFTSPYIIAEIGANHNGDMQLARRLIESAKEVGCDCVKFQSWTKDSVFSRKVYDDNKFLTDDYRQRQDHTLESIVAAYSMSETQLAEMASYCKEVGIDFASTPFSLKETDFLTDELNAEFVKVASMDLNNYPFLEYIARKGRPIVLSTGLSTLGEIDRAIDTIERAGNQNISILHCVADYPPEDGEVNLNNIDMLRANYPEYPIGFSDHSLGVAIPIASFAKGICILEKHFTLDKSLPGWDHKVSATPDEMREIVAAGRRIHNSLGSYRRRIGPGEMERKPAYRRSLVAARPISSGKKIEREDLDFKRPGTGIEPGWLDVVVGRIAKRDIPYDHVLSTDDF